MKFKQSMLETVIGAIVLCVAVGFFFMLNSSGGIISFVGYNYKVYAEFRSVDNLYVGSEVRLAGVKIGTVSGINLNKESFSPRVEMSIYRELEIPSDTSAKILSGSLISGDAYILLEPGYLEDHIEDGGEIIYTQGAIDLMGVIGKFLGGK